MSSSESPVGNFFQQLFDSFGPFSRDFVRNFNLMGLLDSKSQDYNDKINELISLNFYNSQQVNGFKENSEKLKEINDLYENQKSLELEKNYIANQCHDIVSQYLNKISEECDNLKSFKSNIIPSNHSSNTIAPKIYENITCNDAILTSNSTPIKIIKKRQKLPSSEDEIEAKIPNLQVSPDEPTYCICHQFSYGEMVACDNPKCPVEWFHFGCVGLSKAPKGKWYCEKCTVDLKIKK